MTESSTRTLARQGVVFALIGAAATAVHVTVALLARSGFDASPLAANFVGYAVAVAVSYLGNARFTFGAPVMHGGRLVRFVVISLSGLLLNQAITWLLVTRLGLPFVAGLAVVVVTVPVLTFVAARLWAFRAV